MMTVGHPKNGPEGGRKKKGHSFALNMYDFYMILSPGRGGYMSGGLGQWVTLKLGVRGLARGPTLKMDLQTTSRTKKHIVGLKLWEL